MGVAPSSNSPPKPVTFQHEPDPTGITNMLALETKKRQCQVELKKSASEVKIAEENLTLLKKEGEKWTRVFHQMVVHAKEELKIATQELAAEDAVNKIKKNIANREADLTTFNEQSKQADDAAPAAVAEAVAKHARNKKEFAAAVAAVEEAVVKDAARVF